MNQARRVNLAIGAVLTVMSPSPSAAADTYLRWKFVRGEQLRELITTESTTRTDLGAGSPQSTAQTLRVTILRTVRDVGGDGAAAVAQKIERVELRVAGPGARVIEFDSARALDLEGPLAKTVGPVLKALVGAEISSRITTAGETTDVRLPPGLLAALRGAPGAAAMGDFVTEEGLKRLGAPFPAFGVEPATRGKTFDDSRTLALPLGGLQVLTRFTYDGPAERQGKSLHKLDIQVSLRLDARAGAPASVTLKPGASTGTLYFDVEAGRPVAMEMRHSGILVVESGGRSTETATESSTTWALEPIAPSTQAASRQEGSP